MKISRRLAWFILGISVLFTVAGILSFMFLYSASFVEVPAALVSFAKSVSDAPNIPALKAACISLANITETERNSRILWIAWGFGMVILLGVLCAIMSARLLIALGQIDKFFTKSK